ncbi:MAG: 2-C-methyl-D-erythritol 4-phosphate cytidylyltransferase [Actinomycetota bacterium]|nr:2-C-methyl-D-erythritol 4-phosphate cytidylyltransferase [Actinomycetota bacterium]
MHKTVDPELTSAAVIVLAGGSGTRVGAGINKVYLPLAGRRVISWSFTWARMVGNVTSHLLVVRPQDEELARQVLAEEVPDLAVEVIVGGLTRHGSEQAALDHLADRIDAGQIDVVALHDGARPLAGPSLFRLALNTAAQVGGAVPALPAGEVLSIDPGGRLCTYEEIGAPPQQLVRVQTPQAFRARPLLAAYRKARDVGYQGTDTASTVEEFSQLQVRVIPGSRRNLKVTFPHDLQVAEHLLSTIDHELF